MKFSLKKLLPIFFALVLLIVVVTVNRAPAEAKEEYEPLPVGTVPYIDNDTAFRGDYTPFEPKEDTENFSGTAIEGNAEEELQQERIAGGNVGEATSQLEPLHGITDYSDGEYVPVYGID